MDQVQNRSVPTNSNENITSIIIELCSGKNESSGDDSDKVQNSKKLEL